jgi:FkbM family methyltransferase
MTRDPWSPEPLGGPSLPRPDRLTPYLLRRIALSRGAQRRAHLRELGFRMLRTVTPTVVVEDRGMRIHVQTADLGMSRLAYIFGLYEEDALRVALETLGDPSRLSGRDFLDIGANIGTTTLAAVRLGAERVVAVEPAPANLAMLELNVGANALRGRVQVVAAAASDRDGTVELEISATNSGNHRVRVGEDPSPAAFGEPPRPVVEVPAVTIDSLVEAGEVDPGRLGLAWMDVQGHEAAALAGARRLVAAGTPLVLEYWPHGLCAAGGLERLPELLASGYSRFADLRRGGGWKPIERLPGLEAGYRAPDAFTDVLVAA